MIVSITSNSKLLFSNLANRSFFNRHDNFDGRAWNAGYANPASFEDECNSHSVAYERNLAVLLACFEHLSRYDLETEACSGRGQALGQRSFRQDQHMRSRAV